ncbi:MAG: hypothetical protein RIF32_19020 [Leptospirales bacterium]|jgi:hypothetical protein
MSKRFSAYAAQTQRILENRTVGAAENKLFEILRKESESLFCEDYENLSEDDPMVEHRHLLMQISSQIETVWAVELDVLEALKTYLRQSRGGA